MSNTDKIHLQQDFLRAHLEKPIIIVGLMGAGKTSVGKALAASLGYDFIDSDDVIVERAGMSISDIFATKGEPHFRVLEREALSDLMQDQKPHVIGTGGGAFMNDQTRKVIKTAGISIFLKADLDVLLQRVGTGEGRPLLEAGNPREILAGLIAQRYPVYGEADLTVATKTEPMEETLERVTQALYNHIQPA